MDAINWLMDSITAHLGLTGQALFTTLIAISLIARLFAKWIPDDKTGVLGFIRDACKFLGLYVSNRITSGISVGDVAKDVVNSDTIEVADAAHRLAANAIKQPKRGEGGRFLPHDSGFAHVGLIALLAVIALLVVACTPKQQRLVIDISTAVCTSTPTAQLVLDLAADSKDKVKAQRLLDFLQTNCPLVLSLLDTRKADSAGVLPIDAD